MAGVVKPGDDEAIPLEERWLSIASISALFEFKHRYVRETLILREDFPKPMRIDGNGRPRYKAREVLAWAESHRNR